MMKGIVAALAVIGAVLGAGVGCSRAQQPEATLGARDVFQEFKLPPLENQGNDAVWEEARKLQVMRRAERLGLTAQSATTAWMEGEETYRRALREMGVSHAAGAEIFHGRLASELNAKLAEPGVASVVVGSAELEVDTPIVLHRSGVSLDLGTSVVHASGSVPYLIRVEGVHDIHVRGGSLMAGNWGVLVQGADDVTLSGMQVQGLEGGGLAIVASKDVVVWGNELRGLRGAPVLLNGSAERVTIARNEIAGNLGSSNWNAGVVLTDRNVDMAENPANLLGADRFWVKPQPMLERMRIPRDNVIVDNAIHDNGSTGIYSDGSVRNVIEGNHVERNAKEGICLDYGSTADVVAWNLLRANGRRWGKSDFDLKQDFVFQLGRLPDGSSPSKLPAVSIDNAVFNQVVFNQVDANYGGGVKMVRTSFYNVIGLNLMTDNNEGQSARFHFFGIELGAAPADAPSVELDFTPSKANIVFGNTIRGNHYSGIFFAAGSTHNNLFDNEIFGAEFWAMESVRPQRNQVLNNLTNQRSRNIGSGLDPALLKLGAGMFDAPGGKGSAQERKH